MAEETTKDGEVKVPPTVQNKPLVKKPWAPVLTCKVKSGKVGVSREINTLLNSDGSVRDEVKSRANLEITADQLAAFPCRYARKYALWSYFDATPSDVEALMGMTVQAISRAESRGEWPQPK